MEPGSTSDVGASTKMARMVAWLGVVLFVGTAAVFLRPKAASLYPTDVSWIWLVSFGGGGIMILVCSVWLMADRFAHRHERRTPGSVSEGRVARGIAAGWVAGVAGAVATMWLEKGVGFSLLGAIVGLLVLAALLSVFRPRRHGTSEVVPESPMAALVALLVFALVHVGVTLVGIASP